MSERTLNLIVKRSKVFGVGLLLAAALGTIVFLTMGRLKVNAQGNPNPSSNNENTNCPNYTTNITINCPSASGSLLKNSICLYVGDSVPGAPITNSTPSGSIVTDVTETCSNIVTSSTNIVTYSFGAITYVPPKPDGKTPGTFSSEVYVAVTSSDTNCSPSSPLDLGNLTWNVIDGSIHAGSLQGTANNGGKTWSLDWQQGVADMVKSSESSGGGVAEIPSSLFKMSNTNASLYLTDNWWRKKICCTNGSCGAIDKEWYTGAASYSLAGEIDFTAMSEFNSWFSPISSILQGLDPDYLNTLTGLFGFGHFTLDTQARVGGDTTRKQPFADDCSGCSQSYTTGSCKLNISVNDEVKDPLLFNGVDIFILGYFNSDDEQYGMLIHPPDPATEIAVYNQDVVQYAVYSYAKIGPWAPPPAYWVGPKQAHVPTTPLLITTVCTSPNL